MIGLGQNVKDKISGFGGIATHKTEFLYGCIRIGIHAKKLDEKGLPIDAQFFDEPQIQVVGKSKGTEVVGVCPVILGKEGKDKVTGFKGVVSGITTCLYGDGHIGLQSQKLDKDGKPNGIQWFSASRIESTEKKKIDGEKRDMKHKHGPADNFPVSHNHV